MVLALFRLKDYFAIFFGESLKQLIKYSISIGAHFWQCPSPQDLSSRKYYTVTRHYEVLKYLCTHT